MPCDSRKTGGQQLEEGLKCEDPQWRRGRSWRSGKGVETNTRDLQGPGHCQPRQVTNSWAATQHKLSQLSVPLSQTSSHLPAGEGN